jgi:peptidoglycan/LPS O-acetylase OafA/YrhL
MIRPLPYRPEIDGLRTVAVLPVILFHAGFPVFSGGFVGVDVFFVISGYLITTIILREVAAGDFSVLRFYERRARRILPALFVVVLACAPFAWFWMQPLQMRDFGRSVLTLAVYGSNIQFWRESGYFSGSSALKPLLHTWSLSVEIQAYILFPLLLMALRKTGRRGVALTLAGLTVLSLCLAEWGSVNERYANFYLLPSRVWELTAGGLVGLVRLNRGPVQGGLAGAAAIAGLAAIFWAVVCLDAATPFPSLWTLFPVGGAALVILFAGPETGAGRFLSLRPMVGIGLISYALYLWHQPVFAFARLRLFVEPTAPVMAGLALATLPLAWATWKLIETPARQLQGRARKSWRQAGLACTLAMLAGGWVAHATDGLPGRLDPRVLGLIPYTRQGLYVPKSCVPQPGTGVDDPTFRCVLHPELAGRVAVWGDSHALAMLRALTQGLATSGQGTVNLAKDGCRPAEGLSDHRASCIRHYQAAMAWLETAESPRVVIMIGRWSKSLGGGFDNGEGGREPGMPGGPAPDRADLVEARMRESVARLRAAGHLVVLLGNIPEQGWDVPVAILHREWFGSALPDPLSVSAARVAERNRRTRDILADLARDPGVIWIEAAPVFCNTDVEARCIAERNGLPLYLDDDHLNLGGATLVAREILKQLRAQAVLP